MKKIQILFPDPDMKRLREAARQEDRPVSEVVRRATEAWLNARSTQYEAHEIKQLPVFRGGRIRVKAERLRDAALAERLSLDKERE